ncbi:2-amino-4-hydroxy-6-hydroxymethyldihydropteridine diphosphokinase [Tenuibacillus multivorans]|uniref:2-amino-4-hydroxy-6-hydroxymethyldihydropteridine diphosphokinase n=1 Tax=Tenuibacillus multivorans TaxID=237069 RepID=A0A1G9VY76_9BACI|nr:2-amino-4-hydroxy-6-hydroxymethyldihydropteridine diphosphokinase [Tenuibacillus multivorans]GEL78236.1 2-amino-4-hydroxy-6-hydroxymethyldihydropteridine pyrophosphokinase [Tenuibacillus multivorans]SDM76866.1 2-amino-4-hydroxy-6-hydroxymethyldihydropteridinediphosphokinase [Tenuibacillus multivorans]
MNKAYIALGTNIEPRRLHLQQAIENLQQHQDIEVTQVSSIYETKPVGYTDQDDFLNMVIEVQTTLEPYDLLAFCLQVEQQLGRIRTIRFGPRSIDLDLLVFDNKTIDTKTLTIPHPRMHERAFVLVPLQEIAPNLELKGKPIKEWLVQLPKSELDDAILYDKSVLER